MFAAAIVLVTFEQQNRTIDILYLILSQPTVTDVIRVRLQGKLQGVDATHNVSRRSP